MLVCSILCGTHVQAADALEKGFKTPPESAKPWQYWFWMNGNITKEGITADLEAMKRVGIGGALIFNLSSRIPSGRVDFMTDEWRGMFLHAVREADRLGIEISMNNGEGWAGSGGPWNTVENSMQVLTSSKARIAGPCKYVKKLPEPPVTRILEAEANPPREIAPYYRDIAVIAFRTPDSDAVTMRDCSPVVTASDPGFEGAKVMDGDPETGSTLQASKSKEQQFVQFEFAEPFTAQALTITTMPSAPMFKGILQVSADGIKYANVTNFISFKNGAPAATIGISFAPVAGKFYRVIFTKPEPEGNSFAEIELHQGLRIPNWGEKAGFIGILQTTVSDKNWPSSAGAVPRNGIVDITKSLAPDGTLSWDVPAGRWTILRIGHTTTGKGSNPATPKGFGLECDKMSKEALDAHFSGFIGKLAKDTGALAGKSFVATHVDSWEPGTQNWTPKFREEFKARRGYDPLLFLPAALGYPVESAEVSERFLWDYRRTCADLIADNYYGYLQTLAKKHGFILSGETYGNTRNMDNFQCALRCDIPMGEFWVNRLAHSGSSKIAASAAHVAGRKITAAESFTAVMGDSSWREHPFLLKALGDKYYAVGLNRLVIASPCHQPWTNRLPGMTFGPWGIHFERTTTWFEQSTAWLSYLSRCQYLLQEGSFAADFCVMIDENAPNTPLLPKTAVIKGYSYDFLNSEILLTATVRDGAVRLPSGMQYRVLVLSENNGYMTPAVARKIHELVRDGAVVIGPKPERSPSLQDYPKCDREVQTIAAEVWDDCDGKAKQEHLYGKGRVFWGKPLAAVFSAIGLAPDFECKSAAGETKINWIHRRAGDAEVYFVASETNIPVTVDAAFRVSGKVPEFWYPDTGRIETVGVWKTENGRTIVPIKFEPCGSVFVVFRKSGAPNITALTGATGAQIRALPKGDELVASENGRYEIKSAAGIKSVEVTNVPAALTVTGPWEVSFPPKLGAPPSAVFEKLISWPEHTEEGIKYFSGSATYTKEIDIPATMVRKDLELSLDLGRVEVIAEVNVNGKNAGILWKPPFKTDITALVKPGKNTLKIRVTNLWINRLIGDEFKPPYLQWGIVQRVPGGPVEWPDWVMDGGPVPDTGRVTFTTWQYWKKENKPVPSGLLGPVTIQATEVKRIKL